jgi:hypothetical protein
MSVSSALADKSEFSVAFGVDELEGRIERLTLDGIHFTLCISVHEIGVRHKDSRKGRAKDTLESKSVSEKVGTFTDSKTTV